MENLQTQIDSLKNNILFLLEHNQKLEEENLRLQEYVKEKAESEKKYLKDVHSLEEENKKLKVVSAISGNEEYKKLMKLQLNKLIKEIDLCIIELKTS